MLFQRSLILPRLKKNRCKDGRESASWIQISICGTQGKSLVKEIVSLSEEAGISISPLKKTTTSMDTDEEKRDLGQIYFDVKNILGRSYDPRITWKAFWTVGTKD